MARSAIAAMVRLDGRAETEVREGPEAVVHSGSGEFGVAYTIMTWTRDERRKARSMWNRIGEWTWSRRRRQSSWVVVGVECSRIGGSTPCVTVVVVVLCVQWWLLLFGFFFFSFFFFCFSFLFCVSAVFLLCCLGCFCWWFVLFFPFFSVFVCVCRFILFRWWPCNHACCVGGLVSGDPPNTVEAEEVGKWS